MKNSIVILFLLIGLMAFGQNQKKKVLFLGNSYTYVNDLPQMIADAALSMGDTLIFDSHTPGGFSIGNHSLNTISLNKIMAGGWDYVVLQGQSYELATTTPQIYPFPYAHHLDSIINSYNSCAETMFYITWGRKNGDAASCASVPYLCTYQSMDSIIHLNYMAMADSNDAVVSPVSSVWRHIRQTYPLLDLYQADESHPSLAGSYAAACSFYTALFRRDPTLISFNSTLSANDAASIRNTTKLIVYDSLLNWHIGEYDSLMNSMCPVSGTIEQGSNLMWTVYPNPATNQITITTHKFSNSSLVISDIAGRVMLQQFFNSKETIDVSTFANGIYFIEIKDKEGRGMKKKVVKN